jgi:hypothetical protein
MSSRLVFDLITSIQVLRTIPFRFSLPSFSDSSSRSGLEFVRLVFLSEFASGRLAFAHESGALQRSPPTFKSCLLAAG